MTITDDQIENILLWEAVEGGELYMAVWELNVLQPNTPEREQVNRLRPVLKQLTDRAWIRLHWARGWDELAPLTSAEIDVELAGLERWRPVLHGERVITLSITPEGERELQARVNAK